MSVPAFAEGNAFTTIVPVAFTLPQPPLNGTVYVNEPLTVGVPLIIMVLLAKLAVTPGGKPVADPIPVAPVVVCEILVMAVFAQTVGLELAALTVFKGVTVIVPIALSKAQPVGFTV